MSTLKVNAIVDASGGDTSTINSGTPVSTTSTQVAKAWVNFNGTGTVAIREQYNVASITDNGTGDYTVNFTTAMSDANYAPVVSVERTASPLNAKGAIATNVSSSTTIRTTNEALAATDMDGVYVAVFR